MSNRGRRALALAVMAPMFLFVAGSLMAQENEYPSFLASMGIHAGVDLTNLRHNGFTDSFSSRPAFAGGVFATFQFGQAFALQPEVNYIQQGSYIRAVATAPRGSFRLNYLQVPLLFKFLLPITTPFKPNIFAGPYAAYRLNTASTRVSGVNTDVTTIHRWDWGGVFGAGIDLVNLKQGARITADARYILGLQNLWTGTAAATTNLKNRTWMFTLGLGF